MDTLKVTRSRAMDDLHKKFSSLDLEGIEGKERAIAWLEDYLERYDGALDEEALAWVKRTINHLRKRIEMTLRV